MLVDAIIKNTLNNSQIPLEHRFNIAAKLAGACMKDLDPSPSAQDAGEFYAYFNVALENKLDVRYPDGRPGFLSFQERGKYDAWDSKKGMSPHAAMAEYVTKTVNIMKERQREIEALLKPILEQRLPIYTPSVIRQDPKNKNVLLNAAELEKRLGTETLYSLLCQQNEFCQLFAAVKKLNTNPIAALPALPNATHGTAHYVPPTNSALASVAQATAHAKHLAEQLAKAQQQFANAKDVTAAAAAGQAATCYNPLQQSTEARYSGQSTQYYLASLYSTPAAGPVDVVAPTQTVTMTPAASSSSYYAAGNYTAPLNYSNAGSTGFNVPNMDVPSVNFDGRATKMHMN